MADLLLHRRQDRLALEALRDFANVPVIASEADVEVCFDRLIDFDDIRPRRMGKLPRGFVELTINSLGQYEDLHAATKHYLARLVEAKGGEVASFENEAGAVATDLASEFEECPEAAIVRAGGALEARHGFKSVANVILYAFTLLLERRDLLRRLNRCGLCRRFVIDLEDRRGRHKEYCSSHSAQERGRARTKKSRRNTKSKSVGG
jgi:hypothetical protein